MRRKENQDLDRLIGSCLAAFVAAGSLDLSLDRLASQVGVSKRMLIHYFGSRENLEEKAFALLEEQLRERFRAARFPARVTLETVVMALWDASTAPAFRGILQLLMDISKRGWSGSERARAFYREQQRQWVELLAGYLPDAQAVEELLLLFQGAVLLYLVTGDSEPGACALVRMTSREAAA